MTPSPPASTLARLADLVALTKPSINRMCLLMVAGGMFLAFPPDATIASRLVPIIGGLLGTALAVGSANALNMWFERHTDALMRRTRNRPLPAGRLAPRTALVFGLVLGLVGIATLALTTNAVTTLIGALAIVSYAWVYTPLKFRAPLALAIGAIPGAVPPLMGWTAIRGTLDLPADAPGLVLFGILFVWQMPHFLAIAVFRQQDYDDAGIRTVPSVRGLRVTKVQAIAWAATLLPVSLLLLPLGVAGLVYGVTAGLAGLGYLAFTIAGLFSAPDQDSRWAWRLFGASLVYLPIVVAALGLDLVLAP
jgi:protoheme IX farnesyltransferase